MATYAGGRRSLRTSADAPVEGNQSMQASPDDVPTDSIRYMRALSHDVPTDVNRFDDVPMEGSLSTKAVSDDSFTYVCGPCKYDNKSKEGTHYCHTCKENLCYECREYHKKFKEMRDHKISLIYLTSNPVTSNSVTSKQTGNRKAVIRDMKVVSARKVNVKLPDDTRTRNLGGCAFLPNGTLLIIDCFNKRVIFLDSSFAILETLFLSFKSDLWDISAVDDSTAIVTVPRDSKFQFIHTTPVLREGRTITVDGFCYGAKMFGGDIFVCCENLNSSVGDVRVLDSQGKEKRRIGVDNSGLGIFQSPRRITVSPFSRNIYVSDYGNSTASCLSPEGGVIYQYKDESMRRMHGIFVDAEENVLICSITGQIQVLTAQGVKHRTLLSREDGLRNSEAIDFRASDNTLVVGCWLEDNLFIFKLA